jgi:aryl-alcohol dehydrogenase-like predicted oxidoreductase
MKTRAFGNTGLRVSVLGLGCAEIGFEDTDQSVVDRLIGTARDLGINVLDTASMYGDSEEKMGRALHGRREQFLVFTKCGRAFPPKLHWPTLLVRGRRRLGRWRGGADGEDPLAWHPRTLRWSIEQSLRRLRTDRIDLIQLHSCSEQTLRRGDVVDVLHRARQAGKVRYIGYSDDGSAARCAIDMGCFDSIQISVNIADQEALEGVLPTAIGRGMGVIAKRPIAHALWASADRPESRELHAYWDRLRELHFDFLSDDHGFELALRFTISTPAHTSIVGTRDPAHLRENAEYVAAGALERGCFEAIRDEWRRAALPDWGREM